MRKLVLPLLFFLMACATSVTTSPRPRAADATPLPRPGHVVIVFLENKGYEDIIDSPNAPYITQLAKMGASLTFYGFHHPSQPNYFEFFAGTNTVTIAGQPYTVTDDTCVPGLATTTSLGGLLGKNFLGYGEGWDSTNPTACTVQQTYYAQKHCPWTMFSDSIAASRTFTDFQNTAFDQLPLVSMVTPNLIHDMHSLPGNQNFNVEGTDIPQLVKNGDTWLQQNIDAYVQWAMTNNGLLIITFDENSRASEEGTDQGARFNMPKNHIPTVFVGQMVVPGSGNGDVVYNHWDLLRTLEDMYGLPHIGGSATANVITGIWK